MSFLVGQIISFLLECSEKQDPFQKCVQVQGRVVELIRRSKIDLLQEKPKK